MRKILLFALLLPVKIFCQDLSTERIEKFKSSVVRITIEGSDKMGTGFFIDKNGTLLTNYHVIFPSLAIDTLTNALIYKKIFIQFSSGEKYQVKIANFIFKNDTTVITARIHDYCYLIPVDSIKKKFEYFKTGNFKDLHEGFDIITCGYPLGIEKQFISKGIVSTKLKDSLKFTDTTFYHETAYLDLTMNGGNSGGPIVRLGNTINEDRVFGIASFILIPFSQQLDTINEALKKSGFDIVSGEISQRGVNLLFANALLLASNGLSGCVSIDYPNMALNEQKKHRIK